MLDIFAKSVSCIVKHTQYMWVSEPQILKLTNGSGPGSVMGVSDWLQAGRSGDRIPVEAKFSAPVQTGPGFHPAFCTIGTGSFLGVKSGRGVTLTPHPLLVPSS